MRALFDTNAIIYLQKGLLVEPLPIGQYFISVISEIELLSFPDLDETQQYWLNRFISELEVININNDVKKMSINIRRNHRIKIPDAIIAASAIFVDAILLTNDRVFLTIPNLKVKSLAIC